MLSFGELPREAMSVSICPSDDKDSKCVTHLFQNIACFNASMLRRISKTVSRDGSFPYYGLRFFCTCSNELRLISASSSSRLSKQASHCLESSCTLCPNFAMAMPNSEFGFCLPQHLIAHFQNHLLLFLIAILPFLEFQLMILKQ